MAKVREMTRSTGTPMRGTTALSHEMARMAMPTIVRRTTRSRRTISTRERAITTICRDEMDTPPTIQVVFGRKEGICLG